MARFDVGKTVEMPGEPRLRKLLAERVAARREANNEFQPRPGVFDDLRHLPTIKFATVGWRTGIRREKWWIPFVVDGDSIYVIEECPEQAAWVRNIAANPRVEVGAQGQPWRTATARRTVSATEALRVRHFMKPKFGGGEWAFIEDGAVIAFEANPDPAG
jgi:deazaflavin-dependent oxidoreductase (nitroreductase family)